MTKIEVCHPLKTYNPKSIPVPFQKSTIYNLKFPMNFLEFSIPHNSNRLSFTIRDGDHRPWWRDLDLDGEPLYRISNICDTCEMILEKSGDADLHLAPAELGERLRSGLAWVDRDVVGTASRILPKGDYLVALIEIQPVLLPLKNRLGEKTEMYVWENGNPVSIPEKLWPDIPRHIPFWYGRDQTQLNGSLREDGLYEVVLPVVAQKSLDQGRVREYEIEIKRGLKPTAMALSAR